MSTEEYNRLAEEQFSVVGPEISEEEMNSVFTNPFPGREELVSFYLRHNGGSRTKYGGKFHCGNPAHRASRDQPEKVWLEGLYAVQPNRIAKMLDCRSMMKQYNFIERTYGPFPEMKPFLQNHRPIAFDHCGDDLWISLQDGCIKLFLWSTWEDGPVDIAGSFDELIKTYWNIPRENWPSYPPPCGLGMGNRGT